MSKYWDMTILSRVYFFFQISPGVCILMYLSSAKSFTRNDSLKSFSKVHVENGVNNRVESGVDIAQPSDKTNQL